MAQFANFYNTKLSYTKKHCLSELKNYKISTQTAQDIHNCFK